MSQSAGIRCLTVWHVTLLVVQLPMLVQGFLTGEILAGEIYCVKVLSYKLLSHL